MVPWPTITIWCSLWRCLFQYRTWLRIFSCWPYCPFPSVVQVHLPTTYCLVLPTIFIPTVYNVYNQMKSVFIWISLSPSSIRGTVYDKLYVYCKRMKANSRICRAIYFCQISSYYMLQILSYLYLCSGGTVHYFNNRNCFIEIMFCIRNFDVELWNGY